MKPLILGLWDECVVKKMKFNTRGECRIECPTCKSDSRASFVLFAKTNSAYCHRSGCTFSLIETAALLLDIITCQEGRSDSQPTPLQGDLFKETLESIRSEYGDEFYQKVCEFSKITPVDDFDYDEIYDEIMMEKAENEKKHTPGCEINVCKGETVSVEVERDEYRFIHSKNGYKHFIHSMKKDKFCFFALNEKFTNKILPKKASKHKKNKLFEKISDIIYIAEESKSTKSTFSFRRNFFLKKYHFFLAVINFDGDNIPLVFYNGMRKSVLVNGYMPLFQIYDRWYFWFDDELYKISERLDLSGTEFNYGKIFPITKKIFPNIKNRSSDSSGLRQYIYKSFEKSAKRYFDGNGENYKLGFADIVQSFIIKFIGFQFILGADGDKHQGKSNFLSFLTFLKQRGRIYGAGSKIKAIIRDIDNYEPSCYFDDLDKGYDLNVHNEISGILNSCTSALTAHYSFTDMNQKLVSNQSKSLNTFAPMGFTSNNTKFLHPSTKSRTVLLQSYPTKRKDILRFDGVLTKSPLYPKYYRDELINLQSSIFAYVVMNSTSIVGSIKAAKRKLKNMTSSRYADNMLIIIGILDHFGVDYTVDEIKDFFRKQRDKYDELSALDYDIFTYLLERIKHDSSTNDELDISNEDIRLCLNQNRSDNFKIRPKSNAIINVLNKYKLVVCTRKDSETRRSIYMISKSAVWDSIETHDNLKVNFSIEEKKPEETPAKEVKTEPKKQFFNDKVSMTPLKNKATNEVVLDVFSQHKRGLTKSDARKKSGNGALKIINNLLKSGVLVDDDGIIKLSKSNRKRRNK